MNEVCYVPKATSVHEFGSDNKEQLIKWMPEICGVCCFKMIGDTYGKTSEQSLWSLTQACISSGAFLENDKGIVTGMYYKPVIQLAKKYSLKGKIHRYLPLVLLKILLKMNFYPILSIDLHRVNPKYQGTHLIVIINYDAKQKLFTLHDPSSVVGDPGNNVNISAKQLRRISNKRGLTFKPAKN